MESPDLRKMTRRLRALRQSGLDDLKSQLCQRPDQLAAVLEGLRHSPRATINQLFRLTALQRAILAELSDELLESLVAPLLTGAAEGCLTNHAILLEPQGNRLTLRIEQKPPGA